MAKPNAFQDEESLRDDLKRLSKIEVIDLEKKEPAEADSSDTAKTLDETRRLATSALSLTRKNSWLLATLFTLCFFQAYLLWRVDDKLAFAPDLNLEFTRGERIKMHVFKYEMGLRNTGRLFADGAKLRFLIPRGLTFAVNGKLAPPPEKNEPHAIFEMDIPDKILKNKSIVTGPAIFRFDRLVAFQNLEYTLSAPGMEDKHGIFTIHDLDY